MQRTSSSLILAGLAVVLCEVRSNLADPPASRKTASRPVRPIAKAPQKRRDPFEAARALRVVHDQVTLDAIPLDEFVDWLARETKVNVVARWKVLEKAGVERDKAVTLKKRNILLRDALQEVLLAVGDPQHLLAFRAEGNIITISTKVDLDRSLVTKTYDVRDLLVESPRFEAIGLTDSHARSGTAAQAGTPPGLDNAEPAVQQLVRVIETTIFPDSWKVNGGSGTISYFRGHLVIRNTPEVHEVLSGGGFKATTKDEP